MTYIATQDESTGLWGIQDEHGAVVYESDFTFRVDAEAIAQIHNETGVKSFEEAVLVLYGRGFVLRERLALPMDMRAAPDIAW